MSLENAPPAEQLGNSAIRIFFRIYPSQKSKSDLVKLKKSTIFVKKVFAIKNDNVGAFWVYDTDGIFHNCKQDHVFTNVIGDSIERLEQGQNTIIISFGRTGTGKSTTVAGLEFSEEDCGIGPRIIQKLLILKKALQRNRKMCIQMSYVEFSNSNVYDLFKEYPNRIHDHWTVAQKLRRVKVVTEYQALKHIFIGEGRKETRLVKNYRSHINTSILTFYVTTKDMDYTEPRQIVGKIHLVDMAGSDTIGNLSCLFKTKKELSIGNLNKSYVEQFFLALCQRSNEMIKIKQRGNPLIYFLGSDIRTQSTLRFIGHITTAKEDYSVTVSMLRFGQIVRGFSPTIVNLQYEVSPEHKLKYLQNKVEELERERIQNSVLLNQDLSLVMNSERMEHLAKTIKEYLRNQITEIDVMSVTDTVAVFKMFKDLFQQKEGEAKLRVSGVKESDLSITKRKSSSYINNLKKERRGSLTKRPRDYAPDKKRSAKVDKQTSVQSFEEGGDDIQKSKVAKRQSFTSQQGNIPLKNKKSKFKRRSFASVTSSERVTTDQPFVPDNVPENIDAWNEYSKNSYYNLFTEEYKANEKVISDTYVEYLSQIKRLQSFKDQVEAMKQELLEAKILMQFKEKTGDVGQYTETILAEAELLCKKNMEKAEKSLVDQQEIVLRILAELKVYLNIRKSLRKKLSDDFENFCKGNYNFPLPQLTSLTEVEIIHETKVSTTQPQPQVQEPIVIDDTVSKEDERKRERNAQLSHLKNVMEAERKRLKKSRYKIQPYK